MGSNASLVPQSPTRRATTCKFDRKRSMLIYDDKKVDIVEVKKPSEVLPTFEPAEKVLRPMVNVPRNLREYRHKPMKWVSPEDEEDYEKS